MQAVKSHATKTISSNVRQLDHPNGVHVVTSAAERKAMLERYAKCLVSPYDNYTRIPDSMGSFSTLIRSRRVFNLLINPAKGGKFAFFVQPKMGSLTNPKDYQIGVLNKALDADIDNTDAAAYVSPEVYAIDKQMSILCQPSSKTLGLSALSGFTTQKPAGDLTVWSPAQINEPLRYNFTYDFIPSVLVGAVYHAEVIIPPGSYFLDVDTTTVLASTANIPLVPSVRNKSGTEMVSQCLNLNQVGNASTGQSSQWLINVTPGDRLWFILSTTNTAALSRVRLVFNSTVSNKFPDSLNFGAVEKLRPVACSVLCSNAMPAIATGGRIYSTVTDPGSADKIFTTPVNRWDDPGYLTNNFNNVFDGEVKNGTYAWWKPSEPQDLFYREIPGANAYEYSTILVCGQVNQWSSDAPTTNVPAFSVTVEMVYEVQQNTQLFEKKKVVVPIDLLPAANAAVATLEQCTENKTHTDLINDIGSVLRNIVMIGGAVASII